VLLALGLPPLTANVTNTMSLVLTGVGSVLGSRPELAGQARRVLRLGAYTALGGGAGAAVLLLAPASVFGMVVPVLIGGASLLLLAQPWIGGLAPRPGAEGGGGRAGLFGAAMYVGYFGAAGGVLLLAMLGTMIDEPLIRLNALKNAIIGMANGVAAIAFAIFAPVRWAFIPPLAAGFLLGGLTGPKLVRRLPRRAFRVFVALCGLALAVKLGFSAYRLAGPMMWLTMLNLLKELLLPLGIHTSINSD
ncbi:MAG: sulfite exporter TauE/SafE family protein, partial [Streptosporangiaceae bacterium]|nr:sulfite exporter TauE/SafE family protein [Streptosporangiaceae bacterium]